MTSPLLRAETGEVRLSLDWTDEHMDYARSHWAAGDSASQIGKALGRTRGSVCAKLDRMGILKSRKTPAENMKRPHLASITHQRRHGHWGVGASIPGDQRILKGAVWTPLAGSTPVTLLDLEPGMCKWPLGDGKPFLFCGCATDGVYCASHASLATRGPV